jgi:hypothetical protein
VISITPELSTTPVFALLSRGAGRIFRPQTSITFGYRVFKQGETEPWTEGHNVTVCLDMDTFKKRDIPDWLRQQLERHKS